MSAYPHPTSWPVPNYIDPPTRGSPSLFVVMMVISTIVVALRIYSRHFVTKSLGLDDGFLVAGWFLSIGMTFAEYKAMTTWGWDRHIWDIDVLRLPKLRIAAWMIEFFFLWGNACTKISILLVYRKITLGSHKYWFVRLTWAAIAFTVVYTVGLGLELFLICRPFPSYWESYSPIYTKKYTCGNEQPPFVFSAVASVVSDVYSSVLPMMLIRNLNLSRKQRLSLYALFSAGLVTAFIGIGRAYVFVHVTTDYQPSLYTHDISWWGWPLLALTDIEAHLAIIIASLPALKVLIKRQVVGHSSHISSVPSKSKSMQRAHSRSALRSESPVVEDSITSTPRFKRLFQRGNAPWQLETKGGPKANVNHDLESHQMEARQTGMPVANAPPYIHIAQLQRCYSPIKSYGDHV
ncbi:hypothetical protein LTR10_024373 [Elasticomyces elasticus]|uniref:Rhodopsin domain-containing protein n=1 Tax=Exophiala sideris TaxID=1016849 RepID=A0ABR0J204_9EURO|nr:hypothetical protein LTR10_024373 [Elasticomyces elasticus]KAK5024442.1 hypothetical protein LTS07_008733 [Exophiala sideris]KAK5030876.1 hypothetical protein LTR13_007889 [Exophiala sideris]KAK5054175.1 hypothetical protein LTR69_009137 [Exophiala sideris]KAK5179469.1 hypothetical protein LTR44_007985 [Eurotiomycetes sp. CCFEE 6388]